jgi:hypothetical protein
MATKRPLIPTPVPVATVCSICEMPWEEHGTKPTLENCVALLKAALELEKLSVKTWEPTSDTRVAPWPWTKTRWAYPPVTYSGTVIR